MALSKPYVVANIVKGKSLPNVFRDQIGQNSRFYKVYLQNYFKMLRFSKK